jgi:hypothetical protein
VKNEKKIKKLLQWLISIVPNISLIENRYLLYVVCSLQSKVVSFLGKNQRISCLYFSLQFIRFLRRTEGVEAARKYFLDARKSPNCTYHVYVAYAMVALCLDKDPKVFHD